MGRHKKCISSQPSALYDLCSILDNNANKNTEYQLLMSQIKLSYKESTSNKKNRLLKKQKLATINKIIEMCPQLESKKKQIINEVFNVTQKPIDIINIYTKVYIDNNYYYISDKMDIVDEKFKLVGIYDVDKNKSNIYYLFCDIPKI
jgi:hypothetical protein